VKRKGHEPTCQEPIPGIRTALADMVAETLVTHLHRCVAREAAEDIIARAGHTEASFLVAWAAGDFDA